MMKFLEAMRLTSRLGGVFGEPAGVAGVARIEEGIEKGIVQPDDQPLLSLLEMD